MIKRRMSELKALAKLEPKTGILLVEGHFDKNIIREYARSKGSDWAVYDCDAVEDDVGLEVNDDYRTFLVKAANYFAKERLANTICIIDADFDLILRCVETSDQILCTDFANLAMYGLVDDFFRSICRMTGIDITAEERQSVIDATMQNFGIRLTRFVHSLNHKLPDIEKVIRFEGTNVRLDLNEYARRLRHFAGDAKVWQQDLSEIIEACPRHGDPRCAMNDHDFAAILSALLRKKARRNILSDDLVLKIMAAEIREETTEKYDLFKNLTERLVGDSATAPVDQPHSVPVIAR